MASWATAHWPWDCSVAMFVATVAQLALTLGLANPQVSVALIGTRRPERMAEDVGCLNLQLTPAELSELATIMQDAKGTSDELPVL